MDFLYHGKALKAKGGIALNETKKSLKAKW